MFLHYFTEMVTDIGGFAIASLFFITTATLLYRFCNYIGFGHNLYIIKKHHENPFYSSTTPFFHKSYGSTGFLDRVENFIDWFTTTYMFSTISQEEYDKQWEQNNKRTLRVCDFTLEHPPMYDLSCGVISAPLIVKKKDEKDEKDDEPNIEPKDETEIIEKLKNMDYPDSNDNAKEFDINDTIEVD